MGVLRLSCFAVADNQYFDSGGVFLKAQRQLFCFVKKTLSLMITAMPLTVNKTYQTRPLAPLYISLFCQQFVSLGFARIVLIIWRSWPLASF